MATIPWGGVLGQQAKAVARWAWDAPSRHAQPMTLNQLAQLVVNLQEQGRPPRDGVMALVLWGLARRWADAHQMRREGLEVVGSMPLVVRLRWHWAKGKKKGEVESGLVRFVDRWTGLAREWLQSLEGMKGSSPLFPMGYRELPSGW